MSIDSLAFENDDERRRAVAWVVALASTFPVAAPGAEPPPARAADRAEPSAPPVYQVLYRSTATSHLTNQELLALLEQARRYNVAHQITGLLLYSEGQFVHAIEGQEDIIKSLFERIQQDPRHHRIETVTEGWWPARRFGEWSMDFGYAPAPGAEPDRSPLPLPGLSTTSAHLKRLLEACIG
ncbi:BLUF domain-containing protein [Hymenobacter sp. BT664]|uniref:BLUF domain-containing protein n=1 Tax=Hymenobacter montanus TaxID=2771359 RepID=A0A927BFJ3_9BACT|nr:BLUF domain-containing protein [Hymenobacter montanus]MBD2769124.1 BLUF domain-containing protein [Hymenobacter montanus]